MDNESNKISSESNKLLTSQDRHETLDVLLEIIQQQQSDYHKIESQIAGLQKGFFRCLNLISASEITYKRWEHGYRMLSLNSNKIFVSLYNLMKELSVKIQMASHVKMSASSLINSSNAILTNIISLQLSDNVTLYNEILDLNNKSIKMSAVYEKGALSLASNIKNNENPDPDTKAFGSILSKAVSKIDGDFSKKMIESICENEHIPTNIKELIELNTELRIVINKLNKMQKNFIDSANKTDKSILDINNKITDSKSELIEMYDNIYESVYSICECILDLEDDIDSIKDENLKFSITSMLDKISVSLTAILK